MMPLTALTFAFLSGAALAQNQEIQKQLLHRDQQTDAFALQLRQSVEAAKVSPANRSALEARQLWYRQRLENLNEQQRVEVRSDTPEALRPQERQRLEVERRPSTSPIVEVPTRVESGPPPLRPSLKGNVDVIEAPR